MPLVKPRPARASSVPVEEQPATLAMNPSLRSSSLPPEMDAPSPASTEEHKPASRRSSTSSKSSVRSQASSVGLAMLPHPPPQHKEPRLGTLVAVVLRARHLPDRHVCTKQNVYTTVEFCDETLRTKVDVKGGQHPEWDEELRFGVWSETAEALHHHAHGGDETSGADAKVMKISVWEAKKGPGPGLLVGEGILDVTKALHKGEFDEWIPLSREGTQRGEIFMELTYFSAGLPTVHSRPFSAEFRGVAGANNMSYLVQPTASMIAVAPHIERGTPSTAPAYHRTSLPPLPRTAPGPGARHHGHSKSMAMPMPMTGPYPAPARPTSLHIDGLPRPTPATDMPGNFCISPALSPGSPSAAADDKTPTNSHVVDAPPPPPPPAHTPTSASAPTPAAAPTSSAPVSEEPGTGWSDRMSALIHTVADKLHIHHDDAEAEAESEPSSPARSSVSDISSTSEDDSESVSIPGGF